MRVPGSVRTSEAQFSAEFLSKFMDYFEAAIAERRQSSCGATELQDQRFVKRGVEAGPVAARGGEPSSGLQTKGDRRRRLQKSAAQHHGRGVLIGHAKQGGVESRLIGGENSASFAEQQHKRCVGDVLARGAPVNETRRGGICCSHALREHFYKRNRGRSRTHGVMRQIHITDRKIMGSFFDRGRR